jgi:uncharacterized protein YdeI (YjbR/CyaY-like superfamily)
MSMASSRVESRPRLSFGSAAEWREWLESNHDQSDGAWLVFLRSARGKQPLTQREALEEALCFGWIDSQMSPLDEDHFIKLFTPRRPQSQWSPTNLGLARRLISEGRMRPSGEIVIDWGQEGWERELDAVPPDLKEALDLDRLAKANFDKLPPGRRRIHVQFVRDAKREETRRKRIEELIRLLNRGEWLGIEYSKKKNGGGPGKP